jgi:hypothetical protein
MDLLEEGRASIINGLVSYGQHFGLLKEEDITESLLAEIGGMLEGLEALIPVLISMYEMTKKISGNQDLTFMEWLEQVAGKMGGGKEFNLF